MGKRIAAAVLWLLAGWTVGNMLAFFVGFPEPLAPVLGVVLAALVAGDPLGVIWTRQVERTAVTTLDLEHLPEDMAQAA